MEQLKHFNHRHMLHLVQLQPIHNDKNSDEEDNDDGDEDEDEYKDEDRIVEKDHFGICQMCEEEIYSFQLCYYTCNDCDYSLHKFCAELPKTQQNHPLHPGHCLGLLNISGAFRCHICKLKRKEAHWYYCDICNFLVDIICATMSVQKMDHPSHPHQLQRYFGRMISCCSACGDEHSGTFYHCNTCPWFRIHLSCALLPIKLLIQQSTNENLSHSHLLTISYSFPFIDLKARYFPRCRVCQKGFDMYELGNKSGFDMYELEDRSHLWHYRCDKCRYYVHIDCATSKKDAFMSSILMPAGYGKAYKNFKDDDHPNLIHCPFADENVNLLTHRFISKGDQSVVKKTIDGEMFCHPHPLVLFDTILNGLVSLHDPMKKVELLCDGCVRVRPITTIPFYKCSEHDCDFVLHEWCTRLPSQIQDHPDHPDHTLVFMPKTPTDSVGLFDCRICRLRCNGFAYGCMQCKYYVDVNCGFIPDEIIHEAHPNHLLLRFDASSVFTQCKTCGRFLYGMGFYCPTCDFYLHAKCALLLPRTIRHKFDKHPLTLRYYPAENHSSEYFCEICEDEFDPTKWFYHCSTCACSMHTACAPLKLQYERSTSSSYGSDLFKYLNVKFGRRTKLRDHPHPVTFVQGIKYDGQCIQCDGDLQYEMIFKCLRCKFALHYDCGLSSVQETPDTSI